MKTIALFQDNRSRDSISCGDGVIEAMSPHYNIKIFKKEECTSETFENVDMLVFHGGVGDADDYFQMQ